MLAQPDSTDDRALALHAENLPRDRMRSRRISLADILRLTLPDVRWLRLVPQAGHWVQFERSRAYDQALAEALAS